MGFYTTGAQSLLLNLSDGVGGVGQYHTRKGRHDANIYVQNCPSSPADWLVQNEGNRLFCYTVQGVLKHISLTNQDPNRI